MDRVEVEALAERYRSSQGEALAAVGQAANRAAARQVFAEYRSTLAANTQRRHRAGVALFARYLAEVLQAAGLDALPGDLEGDPWCWSWISWGLVAGFRAWLGREGYAVGTIGDYLSVVRVYCRLAARAGALDRGEYAMIVSVRGYRSVEGRNLDQERRRRGLRCRQGRKKARPVTLTQGQARALKRLPADTPQGRRDRLIVCLLVDHGLRCGELAALQVADFDLSEGTMRFYRPKVDRTDCHKLTRTARRAVGAYFEHDALAIGPLLRGSRKDGELSGPGMSTRSIARVVEALGEAVGVHGLSPHDLRHHCATSWARKGKTTLWLMQWFGWNSPSLAAIYVARDEVIAP